MHGRPPWVLINGRRQRCQGMDVILDEDRNSEGIAARRGNPVESR
jgi:hypothetical protein